MQLLNKILNIFGFNVKIEKIAPKSKSAGTPSSTINKHNLIKRISSENDIKIIVETGTYLGAMIWNVKDHFSKIYTIELAPELAQNAREKFEIFKHVQVIEGDSGLKLAEVVKELYGDSIFWLDGHYSGGITARGDMDAPISNELTTIIDDIHLGRNHIILIDDARLFTEPTKYTGYIKYEDLIKWVKKSLPNYGVKIEEDVIIISKSRNLN